MRLIEAEQGMSLRVLGFEGGAKFEERMLQHGLYPGDQARVVRIAPMRGPLLVEVSGREIALGRGVAQKIFVEAI
ncbi:MAG: hypothetical protein Fur0035_11880 [Anaerolineales bacterium]